MKIGILVPFILSLVFGDIATKYHTWDGKHVWSIPEIYKHASEDPYEHFNKKYSSIVCIEGLGCDTIAYGSLGMGLLIADFGNQIMRHYNKISGLPSDSIICLFRYEDSLWVSTPKGIIVMPIKNPISCRKISSPFPEAVSMFVNSRYMVLSHNAKRKTISLFDRLTGIWKSISTIDTILISSFDYKDFGGNGEPNQVQFIYSSLGNGGIGTFTPVIPQVQPVWKPQIGVEMHNNVRSIKYFRKGFLFVCDSGSFYWHDGIKEYIKIVQGTVIKTGFGSKTIMISKNTDFHYKKYNRCDTFVDQNVIVQGNPSVPPYIGLRLTPSVLRPGEIDCGTNILYLTDKQEYLQFVSTIQNPVLANHKEISDNRIFNIIGRRMNSNFTGIAIQGRNILININKERKCYGY